MCHAKTYPRLRGTARSAGFTLFEVLIALAIFAILAVVAYRGLAQMTTAKQALDADTRKWRDLTLVLGRFDEDLSQVAARPWRDDGGVSRPPLRGGAAPIDNNGAKLELVRFDSERFVHLGYRLREERLEMLMWGDLDQAPRSQPQVLLLLDGVRDFSVRFLDNSGQWQLTWPPGGNPNLPPRGVELAMTLRGGDTITRLVALP